MIKLENGCLVSLFLNPLSCDKIEKVVKDVEIFLDDIENHPEMFEEGFSISL